MAATFHGKPCLHGHGTERYVASRVCLTCGRERAKQHAARNPEAVAERRRKWQAENRDHTKAYDKERYWTDPDAARARVRAYRDRDPDACNARAQKWRDENPDAVRAYTQEYYWADPDLMRRRARERAEANPEHVRRIRRESARRYPESSRARGNARRALKQRSGGRYTAAQANALLALQGGHCAYCDERDKMHLDHATPLCRGGTNSVWNLQWLCARHNMSKHHHTDPEYRAIIGLPPAPWSGWVYFWFLIAL